MNVQEINHVVHMIKTAYVEFKQADMMRPFYVRGKATLQKLMGEVGQSKEYSNGYAVKYKECSIENTLKILIRCKLLFHTRSVLLGLFHEILVYESLAS